MLKNNVTLDIKKILLEENISQVEISEKMNLSRQRVSDIINGRNVFVNEKLIELMNTIGYDIRLEFVKQENR